MGGGRSFRYYVCLLYCALILIFNVWLQNYLNYVKLAVITGIGILLSLIVSVPGHRTLIVIFIFILLLSCFVYSAIGTM